MLHITFPTKLLIYIEALGDCKPSTKVLCQIQRVEKELRFCPKKCIFQIRLATLKSSSRN